MSRVIVEPNSMVTFVDDSAFDHRLCRYFFRLNLTTIKSSIDSVVANLAYSIK